MPALDLILRRIRPFGGTSPIDIGLAGGRILTIEPHIQSDARSIDLQGHSAIGGFVDTHVHLDKACLLGRCGHNHGSLAEAISAVSALKREFTVEDVYERGAQVLERAIAAGTTHMRTHVEVDPRAGMRSFQAIRQLKRDYAWAIDLQICAFPQEGLTNDPGTEELLIEALEQGAEALGGCPYTDSNPNLQISKLFDLAKRFDVDLDFHLDFDLDPTWTHLEEVCRQSEAHNYQGRVAIGHVTKLSAMAEPARLNAAKRLAECGVAVTVLPSTDLYLMGRDATVNTPRGVTPIHRLLETGINGSLATNNLMNPFTPFGDASLLRMANLYANIAQAGVSDFDTCLSLVTERPARLMNITNYGIKVGNPADIIVLASDEPASAMAELRDVRMGFKNGRQTFNRAPVELLRRSAGE